MKYYYIDRPEMFDYKRFGTSRIGVSPDNEGLEYSTENFWNYSDPIKLILIAEQGEPVLYFKKYTQSDTYISLMIPALKSVFEKFNMPQHKWYQAKASYDREFVWDMHTYFGIEYDIDLQEERGYWILQFLFEDRVKELNYSQISFDLIDFDTEEVVEFVKAGTINNYDEYKAYTQREYEQRNCVLNIKDFIYKKNYDILWGGIHIVFNEKVKAALEETNIITPENGLEFAEFTDYEIVMLEEDQ